MARSKVYDFLKESPTHIGPGRPRNFEADQAYASLKRIQAAAKERCGFSPPLSAILNQAIITYEQHYVGNGKKK